VKIVYCHNYYRFRGGEDVSFESDVELLRSRGHEVIPFTLDNRDWNSGRARMAIQSLWNADAARSLKAILLREKPDILHCNNLFPQLSVSLYRPAKQLGIPIVQALRNYRAFCANSFLYRDGNVCTKCLGRTLAWPALLHQCYRDSLSATASVVSMQLLHRLLRTQERYVDVFFTPSEFTRRVHIEGGYPAERILCRSNFVLPDLGQAKEKADEALFVGRLSEEKGASTLLSAWAKQKTVLRLKIIGEGPELNNLKAQALNLNRVEFLGSLGTAEVLEHIGRARVLIMPSMWYETFGRTIAEAFSRGTPVIASRLGAMQELVEDEVSGFLFDPSSSDDLGRQISRIAALDHQGYETMATAARNAFENRFSPEVGYQQLMNVYRLAKGEGRSLGSKPGSFPHVVPQHPIL
jgi:glycosyltransferase involved in cell wall biosynthesis